jgi:twitching motility protein PilT
VFGTLHTTTAHRTVTRIVDMFPVDQQEQIRVMLSEALIAVLCQALIPRVDVRGMIAAFEFLYVTNAISNLVRENKTFRIPSSIQTGKKLGMQLLDDHLFQLCRDGKISEVDARDCSQSPNEMHERLEAVRRGEPVASGMPTGEPAAARK